MELKELRGRSIAFGTNITLPLLFHNGAVPFAKTFLRRIKLHMKKESKADWGKTATLKATDNLIPCVRQAVKSEICVFDCSRAYGGAEQRLARALRDIPREKCFIITKIDDQSQFLGKVEECFEKSLKQLNTDYVDLLLLHWPVDYPKQEDERFNDSVPVFARSWKTMEKIYRSGRAKAIGVANFNIVHLELLKKYADVMPMADEFECHPLCIRKDLNEYCSKHNIQVFAYASLCSMDRRLLNENMKKIAAAHDKTIAQIILRWHMQRGRIPIFGTSRPERISEYANLTDFSLTDSELAEIDSQNINYRAFPDSEHCDFTKDIWLGWEKYKNWCP